MIGNRISIFGIPGSGKTLLADRLGQVMGVKNVYHLDFYFWKPGWIKTSFEERIERLDELQGSDHWIIEGNFSNVVEHRLKKSDTVVLLNFSRYVCLWRVILRRLLYLLKKPPLIADGCPDRISFEFLKSIWNFHLKEGVDLNIMIRKHKENYDIIILNRKSEVDSFLRKISNGRNPG